MTAIEESIDEHTGVEARIIDLQREAADLRSKMAELEDALGHAEQRTVAKAEFLSHISHELRTPMNGIMGMTRLAMETELTPEQREYLEVVQSSADSLLTLVNDLLDHAKIEAGKLQLEEIPFRIEDTIANALRTVEILAAHKGLSLELDHDESTPRMVVGDPTRLRQVVLNLAGNAIKFTAEGEVVVATKLISLDEESMVMQVSVIDTGIGIPPDRLESIFEAFEQADGSTTREYGGTGLGLSISSSLVTLMGGEIWVESIEGEGSTFHFTVPFAVHRPVPIPSLEDAVPVGNIPVLVVSDGPVNQDTLVEVLAGGHMHPRVTDDPAKALEALAKAWNVENAYGLIILDLQKSGLEVAWELRREAPDTPMILITPSGQRGDAARCRELAIGGYLTGAVVANDLADAIQAVLAGTPELVTRYWLKEHRRSLSVLVADDSGTNRLLATRLLEKRGHQVTGVANGVEAVAAMTERDFDIVLMDVHMPEMDGYDATRAIRALPGNRSRIPIVALTGSVNDEGQQRCLEAGMNQFVPKPFQIEALLAIIDQLTT